MGAPGETIVAAAQDGYLLTVWEMLARKADANAKTANGMTALLAAGAGVNTHARNGETALIAAARAGYPDAVKALLQAHADIDMKTIQGDTASAAAMKNGHVEIAHIIAAWRFRSGKPAGMAKPVQAFWRG